MDDIYLSQKNYDALLKRLDELNEDVGLIKLKSVPETGFIDTNDLVKLLHVTQRTVQRWRRSGRLPYTVLCKKIYYRADVILDSFKTRSAGLVEVQIPPPSEVFIVEMPHSEVPNTAVSNSEVDEQRKACQKCPLFLIFNYKKINL